MSNLMLLLPWSLSAVSFQLYIVHYMDDLLIAEPDQDQLLKAYTQMQQDLEKVGLIIAPEKVQMQAPYSYLGYQLAWM